MMKIPIVDTHLHIWDVRKFHYPWLENEPYLNKTFTMKDYKKASDKVEIEKIVFVQCECDPVQYKEEVKWVTDIANNEDERIEGIVAFAPLEKGAAVEEDLEELKKNKLVKGVRRIIQYEEDLEFCLKPDFIKGVKLLEKFDMTFDICISDKHNKNVIKFIEKVGDGVRMILDHIGKPNIKDHKLDPWREEIKEIAKFPNVFCKVSSLASEADWEKWTMEDILPFGEHIFECFGFDRTVFGSDWPPAGRAADFYQSIEIVEEVIKDVSEKYKSNLFYNNAIKFYKL